MGGEAGRITLAAPECAALRFPPSMAAERQRVMRTLETQFGIFVTFGKNRGVRKQSNSNGLRPYHEHLCRVSQQDKSKGENNLPSQEAANGFFVFLQLDGFLPVSCAALCPVPSLSAMPSSLTAIPFRYSQPRKRKREKRAKEKGELPRPGCFHNGIILIVNS